MLRESNQIFKAIVNQSLEKDANYFLPKGKPDGIIQIFPNNISFQHLNVKAGFITERYVKNISEEYGKLKVEDIKEISYLSTTKVIKKGKKAGQFKTIKHQLDLVLSDSRNVYYYEVKNNLFLDSGKQRDLLITLSNIENELKKIYPNKKVHCYILHALATTEVAKKDIISKNASYKVIGFDDFFSMNCIDISNSDYARSINYLGKIIMKNSGYTNTMVKMIKNLQNGLKRNITRLLK